MRAATARAALALAAALSGVRALDVGGPRVGYELDHLIHDDHSTAAKVLFWWYPQANTPGCTLEGKRFKELHDYFVHHGVQIVGMSADSQAENKVFSEEYDFNYPLLSDTEKTIPKALGISSSRWGALMGKAKTIEKFWPDVSPTDFPDEALSFLQKSEL
mmetsp:Transcript_125658/g.391283  ORF Transcript_125658/g.391283 Transcript_125658/m.391283 type:complete len:160 (+) Transcript_125658:35-514(+)